MKHIWLSHQLTEETLMYGGAKDFRIVRDKSIDKGDSCNTSETILPSHAGTHVDAPLHFIKSGKCIEEYSPGEWVFNNIQIVNINVESGQLLKPKDICIVEDRQTEMILFKTSFEQFRSQDLYWKENPGLSPELADYLMTLCPNLKIIGMDFLSITSYLHRDIGRKAHRSFLSNNLRLIEDMCLSGLNEDAHLSRVIVLPIRFFKAEAASCTILGTVV